MRNFYFFLLILIISFSTIAQDNLETEIKQFSYALGVQLGQQIGQNLSTQTVDIDTGALLMGLSDIIHQSGLKLTVEEMQAAVNNVQANEQKRQQAAGVKNKLEGENFLAENKNNRDITELQSGLQYKVLIDGTGDKPAASDTVVVHYRGTLIDGTEFDSSYSRGQPVPLQVNGVIQGWQEALPLMSVGSKWQIFVPSTLAYGEQQAGPTIGPNSTLIFEIELLSINK
jgi:FKBP-type peptidyl-prolyl cis-trans isomerase FklB